MNHPARRWARRIWAGVLIAAIPAGLAAPATAADRPAAERTMPHLKFVCPTALGDHRFAGILPDGPPQEQCFFDDGDGSADGSSFAVGVSWAVTPADAGDTRAVCADPARTSWHQDGSSETGLVRPSATRRAHAYVALNLYWPTKEKLARQKQLLAQAEALGNEMLAAAEKLAQPCFPAEPTGSASPSGSSSASGSSGPTDSPEPSPTNHEQLCRAVEGRLTDNAGHPVEGVIVRLSVTGQDPPVETMTDVQGRFRFGDIPDTDKARASDAARLRVLVRDGNGMWRIHAGNDEATLVTDPFALTASGGCRHDLATSSLDGYESTNPAQPADWADLWTVVAETHRALAYLTSDLGVGLRDVPVVIHAWCPASLGAATCTPQGTGAFAYERTPTDADRAAGLGGTGRVPYVALAAGLTGTLSESPQDDTVYHELGHILQSDLAGGFTRLTVENRTNHGGYANASSNDSWIEGFASWFAISVRQADGRRRPYYQWYNGARQPVEPDIKAWDAHGKDEEWAVAGLLTDLTDTDLPAGENGQPVPFTVTGSGWARLISGTADGAQPDKDVVAVDLYDASGTRVASEEAYLFPDGRFLDVPSTGFATARVYLRPADAVGGRDDDPLTMSARTVLEHITDPPNLGTRGGRKDGSSMVFDMSELHSVLRAKLDRPDDVDALFVAHGFHENLKNSDKYVDGATVGMTTHLPFKPDVDPRYNTRILPTRSVAVDTGGVDATVVVFPQGGVPYATTPDASHRVPVMIPGALDSRTAVVTLAQGRSPAVTVIEGSTFWPEAAKHDGSFLTIQPKLEPVSATPGSGPNSPMARAEAGVLGLLLLGLGAGGALLATSHRRRRREGGA